MIWAMIWIARWKIAEPPWSNGGRIWNVALAGGDADHPVFPALADLVARHRIPPKYLMAVIDGVQYGFEPAGV